MDTSSLAQDLRATHALYRVFAGGAEELVPGTAGTSATEAIEAGHRLSREESTVAFSMYRGTRRVHKFNHSTLKLRSRVAGAAALVIA